jgi:ferredoxin
VDRVACTAHGVCASLLPGNVRLDEWGYPVVVEPRVEGEAALTAIRLCPARALYLSRR